MSPAGAAAGDAPVVLRVSGPTASVWADGGEVEARIVPRLPGGPPVAGDRVELRDDEGQPRAGRCSCAARGPSGARARWRPTPTC